MTNPNVIQRGTQTVGLGVTIDRYSLYNRHGGSDQHPVNVYFIFPGNKRRLKQSRTFMQKNGLEKTTNLHFTIFLGAALC